MFPRLTSKVIFILANKKARNGRSPVQKGGDSTKYEWEGEDFDDVPFCSEIDMDKYSINLTFKQSHFTSEK